MFSTKYIRREELYKMKLMLLYDPLQVVITNTFLHLAPSIMKRIDDG